MQQILNVFTSVILSVLTFLGLVTISPYDKPIDSFNGGDPCIVEDETGTYYTFTTGGGVDIHKINSFDDTTVLEQKTVYWCGNDGIVKDIWAPEFHKIGDRWYIIACGVLDKNRVPEGKMSRAESKTGHDDYYRYGFILESKTEDIMGEYEFKGYLAPDGLNNIDGTYLQKDGKLYYICSAYLDVAHQCIYMTEMENPYTLRVDENGKHNSVMLSEPEYRWEKKGWKVNEGPAVLYNNDDIFIVYSASGFSSGGYCMGMLTFNGGDVMDKSNWEKSRTKVHGDTPLKNIYNAGHCSFLYRQDGKIYMVYHATQTRDFNKSPRLTYIKEVSFKDGVPQF